jgi:hypothetical protein
MQIGKTSVVSLYGPIYNHNEINVFYCIVHFLNREEDEEQNRL